MRYTRQEVSDAKRVAEPWLATTVNGVVAAALTEQDADMPMTIAMAMDRTDERVERLSDADLRAVHKLGARLVEAAQWERARRLAARAAERTRDA